VINTPTKKGPATDEGKIRALCVANRIPIFTTLTAARAVAALRRGDWDVRPIQSYHRIKARATVER
jgi:carbamoyl-phosphate synthase large subunit